MRIKVSNEKGLSFNYSSVPVLAALIFFFLFTNPLNAQIEAIDSLDRILYSTSDKVERIKIEMLIAAEHARKNPERALDMLDQIVNSAINIGASKEQAGALSEKGNIYNRLADYSLAIGSYLESLRIYTELGLNREAGYTCYRIAFAYKNLGDYSRTVEYCMTGIRNFEKSGFKDGLALVYRVMGSVYKYKGDYEQSLYYYFSGLDICEQTENRQGIANSYNNIGVVFFIKGDYEKALSYYRQSLEINMDLDNSSEYGINYGNIGNVFLVTGETDSAKIYFDRQYEVAISTGSRRSQTMSRLNYGDYYRVTGDNDRAAEHYLQALEMSRETRLMEYTRELLLKLSDLHFEINDYDHSLFYYKAYISVKDSLMNKEVLQTISQLKIEYEVEKEASIIAFQEQRKRMYRFLGFSLLVIAMLLLLLAYLNQKVKLKRREVEQNGLMIEKRQLQNEIDLKKKELTGKVMFLAERNELISDISMRLQKTMHSNGDISGTLHQIIRDMEAHSNSNIWNEFEFTFLQVHPGFFDNLSENFPSLTSNEKRLSALLRLNLSTKDISNITHQSLHSLTVARTRLRKKLGLSNTSENLSSFLSRF